MPPLTLDVFNQDAFSAITLTDAINKEDFLPSALSGLFQPIPVTTITVMIEERDETLNLIQTSPRGGVPAHQDTQQRTARSLVIPHLAKEGLIMADEIQNVRAFGTMTEEQVLQAEINRRNARMRRDVEYTWELHRLGAVQGIILDADGSEIYNLFTEFGVSQESEVNFDLDNGSPAAGALRKACTAVVRAILRNLKTGSDSVRIRAECGDAFWDDLIAHTEVRATYTNWAAAEELRANVAFSYFQFGGIEWRNYRGSDDNSTVAIDTNKCHLYPVGVPGLYEVYYAPADTIEFVNTPGLPVYAMQAIDPEFERWVKLHVQSNPLHICTRPKVLMKGKRT